MMCGLTVVLLSLTVSSSFARFIPFDEPDYTGDLRVRPRLLIPYRPHFPRPRAGFRPMNEVHPLLWGDDSEENKPFVLHSEAHAIHDNVNGVTKNGMARSMIYAVPNSDNHDDKVVSFLLKFKADGYLTLNIPKKHSNSSEHASGRSRSDRVPLLTFRRNKRTPMDEIKEKMQNLMSHLKQAGDSFQDLRNTFGEDKLKTLFSKSEDSSPAENMVSKLPTG